MIKAGTTNVVRYFMMRKVSDGTAFTGATITTFDLQYTRELTAAATKIDGIVGTGGATTHVDNKVFELDATSSPGLYMVCFPDAAFAAGVNQVTLSLKYDATVFTEAQNIQLVAFDPFDTVRMGMTALPNAAAAAAGGIPLSTAGSLEMDTLADWVNAGRLDAILDELTVNVDAIETDTQDLQTQVGTAGAGLTGITGAQLAADQAVNATKLGGATVTATTSVTIPAASTLATTTGAVGSVTGAVGSVTGAVGSVTGGLNTAGTITTLDALDTAQDTQHGTTQTAITNLNDPTAASIADAVWDEPIEDHDTQGNMGWSQMLTTYLGPDGPGVFIDSTAANTNTVVGTDGTEINPVSTPAAARTIADAIGVKVYYLEGNSDITLGATHIDWEFIGFGAVADNVINLGSSDVSRSLFRNLTIEGTQGGTGRITAKDCALQDPGAGDTTLHIFAERCGIVDRIQIDTANNNVFDQCFSLVAGSGTPVIQATGAAGTVALRHYSGGIEFETLSASHNVSVELVGQVVFNADCNVNANVAVRGTATITDNTAGMASLTETATVNMAKVNAEVVDVLFTDTDAEPAQGAPGATISLADKIGFLYKAWRNRSTQTATQYSLYNDDATTIDHKATVSDDATTADKTEVVSGP
jgi:hypothetical protein